MNALLKHLKKMKRKTRKLGCGFDCTPHCAIFETITRALT